MPTKSLYLLAPQFDLKMLGEGRIQNSVIMKGVSPPSMKIYLQVRWWQIFYVAKVLTEVTRSIEK